MAIGEKTGNYLFGRGSSYDAYGNAVGKRGVFSVDIERARVSQFTIFKIVGGIILLIILYFVLWPYIKKRWATLFSTKVSDVPPRVGGGSVTDSFIKSEMESYVKGLRDAFENDGWLGSNSSDNCEQYKRVLNDLNDNQIIAVANSYKNTFGETIRVRVNKASSGCGFLGTDYKSMLVAKLNALSIP